MSGHQDVPAEAPPSYQQATGSSAAATSSSNNNNNNASSYLNVPGATSSSKSHDGIPAAYRRSMEDEMRPLPEGWVRTYDPSSDHQFFVNTKVDPPRSIWHHPYDDEEYLSTLPAAEREHIEQDSMNRGKHHPSKEDMIGAHSDEDEDERQASSSYAANAELPPREGKGKGKQSFGRKLKDKVTGMTHEQRVEERRKRAEAEQKAYQQHLAARRAMQRAMETGQPQLLGKDRDGKDVYIEPPAPVQPYGGGMYGGFGGRLGGGMYENSYRHNPYGGDGIYTTPNARYIRPQGPYGRPYGSGYGGGYGLPIAAGLGGGLLGGLLLGDLLF